eukprot:scaffold26723_cov66-Phaeocystis_antarctica.AAC.2
MQSTACILRLTICPQVDKGSGHMWIEEQRQASRRRHGLRSTTIVVRRTAVRWFSKARLRAVQQQYTPSRPTVTAPEAGLASLLASPAP